MARMLVKFRTCFGVNGSMRRPNPLFIGLLRRLLFVFPSSGQLCACCNFTTTSDRKVETRFRFLNCHCANGFVDAQGSHKGPAGAWGPVTAHIVLSKYCM